MAQASGNWLERHVEKLVLAVCAPLLAYGLVHWIFSSPRKLDDIPLKNVDRRFLDRANQVKKGADTMAPEKEELPDYGKEIERLRNPAFGQQYARSALDLGQAGRGAQIYVAPPLLKSSLAELTPLLPPPPRPQVQARMELPNTGADLADVRASHGVLIYPWGDLSRVFQEKLGYMAATPAPIVLEVEVQVQEKLANGQWGVERKVSVPSLLSGDAAKKFDDIRKQILTGDLAKAEDVRAAIRDSHTDNFQQQVLTPGFWPVWDALVRGWSDWKTGDLVTGPTEEIRTTVDRQLPPPTTETMPSGPEPGPGVPPAPKAETAEKTKDLPPLGVQKKVGSVLVWFHDTALEETKVYRYRVRLELANPFLTYPNDTRNAADARERLMQTPWSDWSEEVSVPKTTEFFITGDNAAEQEVMVTVFTRTLGEPVQHPFYVKAGQAVGAEVEKKLMYPGTGQSVLRKVNFFTGAIGVGFDFDRRIVQDNLTMRTVSMVYLDEGGQLRTRIRALDEDSPRYREWIKAIRAASAPPGGEKTR